MKDGRSVVALSLATAALIVAIFTGVLAVLAYNRTGADMERRIHEQVDMSMRDLRGGPGQNKPILDGTNSKNTNTSSDTVPQTQP